jgi:SOS-response transcriptional repressor LexA
MENWQIRYLNARLLIAQECAGEVTRFSDRLGKCQPQASAFAGSNPNPNNRNKKRKKIGDKIAREISDAFGKHRGWLDLPHFADWQAAGLWNPDNEKDAAVLAAWASMGAGTHSLSIRRIPIVAWVAAGGFSEAMEMSGPDNAEEWVFTAATRTGPRSFALRVVGDSMTNPYPGGPSYPHGTIIVVDPDRQLTVGSRVIAKRNGEEATFKVYTEDGGRRLLKPLNPQYPIVEMTEDFHICGVVVGRWIDD